MPVIPTLNMPVAVEEQVRFEVPVPLAVKVTLGAVNAPHDKPVGTVSVNATVPAKLNVLVKVTVEVNEPIGPVGEDALIEKSPTWTVELAE